MKTKLTKLFKEFFENEQASGIVLIICTAISIIIANSYLGKGYIDLWHHEAGFEISNIVSNHSFAFKHSIEYWINDGLMAIFFLLIGLEIERELYVGELSDPKDAILPVLAAIGGMMIPALLYFSFNLGTVTQNGIGIPMATDIAFALGVLALLGNKVPVSLKVFITALAIIDDLGAIVVIALFYVNGFSLLYFILALSVFAVLLTLNRLKVQKLFIYLLLGVVMWYFMLKSGVHATLAGVLLAFTIPFKHESDDCPSHRLQHVLHKPVAFFIMPIFALANTCISLNGNLLAGLVTTHSLGIMTGLLIGKPLGIILFTFLAVKLGLSKLPNDINWSHVVGAGVLGGIGFTMSIFITLLAFDNSEVIQTAKIAILVSSLLAGLIGYLILNRKAVRVSGTH
jgi:NhaA family Na+:H+ antiporter